MRIERVKLVNFCQHPQRDDIFEAGVVGVVGKNGAGKSNYLRAIRRALTGSSGNPGNKEDDLRWGAEKGLVRVDFVANSRHGFVQRDLISSRCRMEYDDGTKALTASEIDKKIYQIIGIQPKVLSDVVFVEQGSIEGLLFEKPSERTRSMQALFGTAAAEPLREHLKTELDATVVTSRTETITKIRAKLATEIEGPLAAALAAQAAAEKNLVSEQEVAEMQEVVKQYEQQQKSLEVSERANSEIAQLTQELADATAAETNCSAREKELHEITELLKPFAQTAEELITKAKEAAASQAKRAGIDRILAEADKILSQPEPVDPCLDPQALAINEATWHKLSAEYETSLSIANNPNVDANCPTCQQKVSLSHVLEHTVKCADLLPQVKKLGEQHHKDRNALTQYRQQYDTWKTSTTHWAGVKAKALEDLAQLPTGTVDTQALKDAEATFADYRAAASSHVEAAATLKQVRERVRSSQASLERANRLAATVTDTLGEPISDQHYQEAKVELQKHNLACRELNENSGKILILKQLKASEEATLKQYEAEEQNLGSLKKWRDQVERARALLHRDQLPSVVARVFLDGINRHLARYLDIFNVPFTAQITPEGVKCTFSSKTDVPAERLSGGQRVMLGLAFRFSVYEQFVSSLGIMILDEPTVYLDDDHVDVAVELLLRVKSYSKSAGLQLIVVTHDHRLASVFDQTITV